MDGPSLLLEIGTINCFKEPSFNQGRKLPVVEGTNRQGVGAPVETQVPKLAQDMPEDLQELVFQDHFELCLRQRRGGVLIVLQGNVPITLGKVLEFVDCWDYFKPTPKG